MALRSSSSSCSPFPKNLLLNTILLITFPQYCRETIRTLTACILWMYLTRSADMQTGLDEKTEPCFLRNSRASSGEVTGMTKGKGKGSYATPRFLFTSEEDVNVNLCRRSCRFIRLIFFACIWIGSSEFAGWLQNIAQKYAFNALHTVLYGHPIHDGAQIRENGESE
nr:hypothetical protein Iba_chr10bCG3530 [Ipomoea batatas]